VILLVTEANAKDIKFSYENKVSGFVMKPVLAENMQAALTETFKNVKDTSGKALALEMNYTAAKALAGIDVVNTALPVQNAIDALTKSLTLPDEVRLESMKALANIAVYHTEAQSAQNDLCTVAAGPNSIGARLAALEALTSIAVANGGTADTVKQVAEKLLLDKEPSIRLAASQLVGASATSTSPVKRLLNNADWVGNAVKIGNP